MTTRALQLAERVARASLVEGSALMRTLTKAVMGAFLGGCLLLVLGAFVGGNFATSVELFGLRGYEATGVLGLLMGLVVGAALAVRLR